TVWGSGLSEKVVWHVVRQYARKAGIDKLAPHDLRRTRARLCHQAGGELDQIQFLLGHVSVQTTERYLGCKQRIRNAVNDRIGIQPKRQLGSGGLVDRWPANRNQSITETHFWADNRKPSRRRVIRL